nr:MAG TPA: hypothetical protein [Caudoviricetes sp.]
MRLVRLTHPLRITRLIVRNYYERTPHEPASHREPDPDVLDRNHLRLRHHLRAGGSPQQAEERTPDRLGRGSSASDHRPRPQDQVTLDPLLPQGVEFSQGL